MKKYLFLSLATVTVLMVTTTALVITECDDTKTTDTEKIPRQVVSSMTINGKQYHIRYCHD